MTTNAKPYPGTGLDSYLVKKRASQRAKVENLEMLFKITFHPVGLIFLLTFIVAAAIALFSEASVADIVAAWGGGLTSNFGHAMQFMLLLLLSYTLAVTPACSKALEGLGARFGATRNAVIFLVFFSSVACWLNWALGAVGGVFLARQIALGNQRRGMKVNYPLLVAAGLSGLVVSESGLSGNVLLFMTQPSKLFSAFPATSLSSSAFSLFNLTLNLVVVIVIAACLAIFSGRTGDDDEVALSPSVEPIPTPDGKEGASLAVKMETSRVVSIVFGAIGLLYIILHFSKGGSMNFNTYLLLLIALGIVLRKAPLSYQADVIGASSYAWIFFFPLIFAGAIQGMLNMETTREVITRAFMSISKENTFPEINMIFAGLINFIVPNAGAQWLIEGNSVLAAGKQLNLSPVTSMLSFCYGAGVAKTINIFVILPILGIVGVKPASIFKYMVIVALVSAIVYMLALMIFF